MGRHSRTATVDAPSERRACDERDLPGDHARVLVLAASRSGTATCLALADGRSMRFDAAPDAAAADRVRAGFRRVHRAELLLGPGEVAATVHGTGHRREGALPVSVETALAFALAGCPTIVGYDRGVVR